MTGEQAVEWIHGQYGLGQKEGLTNTAALLERLGQPHLRYPCIHVAGTNGKGSICSMLSSILMAAGLKVGLYTSPYLERFNERIRVDGQPIADRDLGDVATDVRRHVEALYLEDLRATVFEIGTVCAFEHFDRAGVDIAVIEVGLGGRLDATNVISPILSVIAHIGLDHMSILGDTIQEIAADKAGIVKPGVPCVLYPQGEPAHGVIAGVCAGQGSPLVDAVETSVVEKESRITGHHLTLLRGQDRLEIDIALPGDHQIDNVRTAATAALALRDQGLPLSAPIIEEGLRDARWPGRLEWIGNSLLDGAHNEQGAQMLAAYASRWLAGKKVVALCAVLRGKAMERIVDALAPAVTQACCVTVPGHKANDPQELADAFANAGTPAQAFSSIAEGLLAAREAAGEEGVVLVCGSLYLVGAVRGMLCKG